MLEYFTTLFMTYLLAAYIFSKYLKKFGYSKRLVFDDMVTMVYHSTSKTLNSALNITKKNRSRFCLEFLLYVLQMDSLSV